MVWTWAGGKEKDYREKPEWRGLVQQQRTLGLEGDGGRSTVATHKVSGRKKNKKIRVVSKLPFYSHLIIWKFNQKTENVLLRFMQQDNSTVSLPRKKRTTDF